MFIELTDVIEKRKKLFNTSGVINIQHRDIVPSYDLVNVTQFEYATVNVYVEESYETVKRLLKASGTAIVLDSNGEWNRH